MLIIDANTWSPVFDCKNATHKNFCSIKDYVLSKPKTLAWGGTKYIEELKKSGSYLKLYNELSKAGYAISFCNAKVDQLELNVTNLANDKKFDDPHILALQIASKAPVIVTADKRSHRFLKLKRLYPKNHPRPKLYTSSRNKALLAAL